MAFCRSCKSKNLFTDDSSGNTFCTSCGIIQHTDELQHHFGGVSGTAGTFIHVGTVGSGTNYSYKERKLLESNRIIQEITEKLGVRASEVKPLVDQVTDGEFGLGNWFHVLVGACCYISMRQRDKCMSINEIVTVVDCDIYELGRMISRVVEFLGLDLPEFSLVGLFERMVRLLSGFKQVDDEKQSLMIKQGTFVIQCAVKWFLTTGRRPGPMVVAVLVFVGELNEIGARLEDVAKEMNLAVRTCKVRYKELLEALVEVARVLPWGKDVNVKNIVRNAPFVIRYMEMKSMECKGVKRKRIEDESCGFDLDNVLQECLKRDVGCGIDYQSDDVENGLGRDKDDMSSLSASDLQSIEVSIEDLTKLCSKFKAEIADRGLSDLTRGGCNGDSLKVHDYGFLDEWWSGRSELCKRLEFHNLMEKDVGFEALPPSYIRGLAAVERRREKIKAAKIRIKSIVCPQNNVSSDVGLCSSLDVQPYNGDGHCITEYDNNHKKRRKQCDNIDWEDFIIEALLLHQVKEEEIEKGHYKALLGLHVFVSDLV